MFHVEREPPLANKLENCCFCRVPTPFWYRPNDVACCQFCARLRAPEQVPTKKEWMATERHLMREAYPYSYAPGIGELHGD